MLVRTKNSTYEIDFDRSHYRKLYETAWKECEFISPVVIGKQMFFFTARGKNLMTTTPVVSIKDEEPAFAWTMDKQ